VVGDPHIEQTVSIGVATWNGRETAEALEIRADGALYVAKRDGRNRSAVAELAGGDGAWV
jgi:PleD family two-component response regulator